MDVNELRDIVFKVTGKKIVVDNENVLLKDLDIDSLSFLEIVVEIEKIKGKEFPDVMIFNCKTVRELLDFVDYNIKIVEIKTKFFSKFVYFYN